MGLAEDVIERVASLTPLQMDEFYKQLGQDTFEHFLAFQFYPQSDFARMVDYLLKEIERSENGTK